MRFSDRSRYNEFQRCNRARYLGYEWGGIGLRRNRASIPLTAGIAVHVGRAHMLSQLLQIGDVPRADLKVNVDEAVQAALDAYSAELADRGLDVELGEDAQAVVDEQRALIEGLLRAYAKAGLPALLEHYRVLEVEREDVWPAFTSSNGTHVDFQSRADALLQERSSGDLYVDSLKTAAAFDYRKDAENRHDVQGLSEAAVVERRLREWWQEANQVVPAMGVPNSPGNISERLMKQGCSPQLLQELWRMESAPPRIMGIQMTFLVKGMRRQAYDGAPYFTSSPLLKGYYREGITEREFAWKAETPCPGPGHVLRQGKKGPILCEGKQFHKLGAEWVPFETWRNEGVDIVGGVKGWVEMLASGTIQPDAGDPFEAIVQSPLPYFRQDQDVTDWVEQAQGQEARVAADAALCESVRVDDPKALRSTLNRVFVQNRRACDWPSKCQFAEICWGDNSMLTSPCSTGLYQLRVAHHDAEREAMDAMKVVAK